MKKNISKNINKKYKILKLFLINILILMMYQNCSEFGFKANDVIADGQILEGYISGISFTNKKVTFTNQKGYAIFEGDIILGKTKEILQKGKILPIGSKFSYSLGHANNNLLWENGVIPYELTHEGKTPSVGIDKIENAIKKINEKTVLTLVPRTNQKDYIYFTDSAEANVSYSYIGKQGGAQAIQLALNAGHRSIVHETFHAAGLWHEHSREDRDNYIEIFEENIEEGRVQHFNQHIMDGNDLGKYDYESIMHYGSGAFSKNGKPTILKKGGGSIPRLSTMSEGDREGLVLLYPSSLKEHKYIPLLKGRIESITYTHDYMIVKGAACDKNSIEPVKVQLFKFDPQSGLKLYKTTTANNDHEPISLCGNRRNIGFKFLLRSISQNEHLNETVTAYVKSNNGEKILISRNIFLGINNLQGTYNMDKDLNNNFFVKGTFSVELNNDDLNYDIINYEDDLSNEPIKVGIIRKNQNTLMRNFMGYANVKEIQTGFSPKFKYFSFEYPLSIELFNQYQNEEIQVDVMLYNKIYELSSGLSKVILNTNTLALYRFGFSFNSNDHSYNRHLSINLDKIKELFLSWSGTGATKITFNFELLKKLTAIRNCEKYAHLPYCINNITHSEDSHCGLKESTPGNKNIYDGGYWEENTNFFNNEIHLNFNGQECLRYGYYKLNLTLTNDSGEEIKDSISLSIL